MDAAAQRKRMVDRYIRARGVHDERVLAAMETVPREAFLPPEFAEFAYEDRPLPIEAGQTISQPYIVALITAALGLEGDEEVLEIGTGSGYAAAVLAKVARRVYTIERHGELAEIARERLAALGYHNVEVRCGDGTLGWPEHAPFDAIVVAAGGPEVPRALLEQLEIGARLVIPVGTSRAQALVRVTRVSATEYRREDLGQVTFVPLIGEQGWAERKKRRARATQASGNPGPLRTARPASRPAPISTLIAECAEPLSRIDEMAARGEHNVGQLCRTAFGDGVYIVGFGTDHGTVAAAHSWDDPMTVMQVRPARPDSYERLCHDAAVPAFTLALRQPARDDLRDELTEPRLERAIGVVYRPDSELQSHYFQAVLPGQFDEYIWFDETSAVDALSAEPGAPVVELDPSQSLCTRRAPASSCEAPMTEHDLMDTTIATSRQWLHELMALLELPPDEAGPAIHALRAGIHAIRDRLPATEVVHLGARLPVLIRGLYYDGWQLGNDPTRIRTRAQMIERVQREIGSEPRLSAPAVISAVITLLKNHVKPREIADVVSTLPQPIATLWTAHP